jgi:tetratricopeptide (TPR) repeat protein
MNTSRFPLALALALLTAACAAPRPAAETTPPAPVFTQEELDLANRNFMSGLVAFELGEYESALDLLSLAYLRLPQHAGVNFALADAYIQTADLVNALFYAREAVRLDSKNRFYHLKLAEIHLRAGQNAGVVDVMRGALRQFPNDSEFQYLLANALFEQGQHRESNRLYAALLKRDPDDISLHAQKYRNHVALNELDSAVVAMEAVRRLDPGNLNAVQTLSRLHLQMKDTLAAVRVYEEALDQFPDRNDLKIALTDLHISQGQWDKAGDRLSEVVRSRQAQDAAKSELVQFVLSRFAQDPANESLKAMTARVVEAYVDDAPDNAMAQALAADFYGALSQRSKALTAIETTLRLRPENAPAWRQRLQLLYEEGRYADLIALADSAETYAPEDAFIRFFVGLAYLIENDHTSAVDWLTLASKAPARPPFRSMIFGSLADATYQTGAWEAAKRQYEEAIRLNPDNDTALNNYAYYMSLKGERLDVAKEMSARSLKLQPDNTSFLDTYGWIHYLLGDYDTALRFISASIEKGSQSAEVHEHKGDVLFKLERIPEAIVFWRKAVELDPRRRHLLDRIEAMTP